MEFYRRKLPHWHPEDAAIFLTWRLHGSMPIKPRLLVSLTEGQRFAAIDRELDKALCGPTWLKDPRIALVISDTLRLGQDEWKLYRLLAWVIMSNHVHMLINPYREISAITRAIKKHTATRANQILARRGDPFWQDESYDRWVRDSTALSRIVRYIEWNPVRAGLVAFPEQYRWSSAFGQVGNLPHED